MRLFKRARASHALSLLLCVVLLGAMAVPALAANDGRSGRGAAPAQADKDQGEDEAKAQAKDKGKDKDKDKEAKPPSHARSQSAGSARSDNASSQGQSASAAKSGNGAARSQQAKARQQDKAQAKAQRTADKRDKREKAADESKATAEGEHSPAGNKGSMKVRPVGTSAHPPRNYAHLPCTVQVDFYGSPHSGATLTAVSHAPTAPTGQTLLSATMTFSQSSANPRGNELVGTTTLDFTSAVSGLTRHAQQGYHVKLTAEQDGPQGGNVKHKVFWIDCPPPAAEGAAAATGEADVAQEPATVTQDDTAAADAEVQTAAGVMGLSGSIDRASVAGGAVAPAEGRVLGATGATVPRSSRALAATGLGVLALALLGLVGLGGGAGMLRRFRRR